MKFGIFNHSSTLSIMKHSIDQLNIVYLKFHLKEISQRNLREHTSMILDFVFMSRSNLVNEVHHANKLCIFSTYSCRWSLSRHSLRLLKLENLDSIPTIFAFQRSGKHVLMMFLFLKNLFLKE